MAIAMRTLLLSTAAFGWAMLVASDSLFALPSYCVTGAPSLVFELAQMRELWFDDVSKLAWLLMLLAMLPPLLLLPADHVIATARAQQRTPMVAFLAGYAGVWLVFVPVLMLFAALLTVTLSSHIWLPRWKTRVGPFPVSHD